VLAIATALLSAVASRAQAEESLLSVQHTESVPIVPGESIIGQPTGEPQQPLSVAPLDSTLAPPVMSPLATGPADYEIADNWHGMPQTAPVSWISGPFFNAGVLFGVGGGILADMTPGYTIGGGYRQPLGPEVAGDRVFFEIGGSYGSMFGTNTQFIPETRATVIGNQVITSTTLNMNRTSTMHELREAALNTAVGWYWGPPIDDRAADPQLRFATRLGGRVGHARGRFFEEQVPVTPVLGPNEQIFVSPYEKKDTFGGFLIGQEAILLNRDYAIGHVQWTIGGQYTVDWIDLGGRFKGSLSTLALTSGFMLSW
jgi:hypothetical protein